MLNQFSSTPRRMLGCVILGILIFLPITVIAIGTGSYLTAFVVVVGSLCIFALCIFAFLCMIFIIEWCFNE